MLVTISKKKIAAAKAAGTAKADAALSKALALAEPFPKNFIDLAEVLGELSSTPDHVEKFTAKSGIGKRKVQYLISMHQKFSKLQVSRDTMLALGWTKLITIRRAVNVANLERYLAEAKNRTVADLQRYVRQQMADNDEEKHNASESRPRVVLLRFTENEYEKFQTALRDHGAEKKGLGLRRKEAAIMKIIAALN